MISQLSPATVSSQTRPTASTSPWKAVAELVGVEWHPVMSLLALDDDLRTVPSGRSRCLRSRARASSRRIRSRRSVPRASPLPRAAPELANLIAPVRTCPRERTQRPAFLGTQEEISSRRSPAAHHASEPRTLRPEHVPRRPGSRMSRPRTRRARSSRDASVYAHACSRPPHAQSI